MPAKVRTGDEPIHRYVADADTFKDAMAVELERLSRLRLEEFAAKLKERWPRLHGKIIFGMGTEAVTIGGKQRNSWDVEKWPTVLRPLYEAINDIDTITNGYRLACPEDFEW